MHIDGVRLRGRDRRPNAAAGDRRGGNEGGLTVTSCIAHSAPEAADRGFLWRSVSRQERTGKTRRGEAEEPAAPRFRPSGGGIDSIRVNVDTFLLNQ